MTDFHCRPEDREVLGQLVKDWRAKGETLEEIGKRLGCTKERVRQIIKYGPGTRGRAPALPEFLHEQIWHQFNEGIPVLQLAKLYETSYSIVRGIILRKLALLPKQMAIKDYQKAIRQDSLIAK